MLLDVTSLTTYLILFPLIFTKSLLQKYCISLLTSFVSWCGNNDHKVSVRETELLFFKTQKQ